MARRLNTAPMVGIRNALGCTCCHSKNELRSLGKSTKLREKAYLRHWEDDYGEDELYEFGAGECAAGYRGCFCNRAEESSEIVNEFHRTHGWDRHVPATSRGPVPRDSWNLRLEDLPDEILEAVEWPRGMTPLETLYWLLGLGTPPAD